MNSNQWFTRVVPILLLTASSALFGCMGGSSKPDLIVDKDPIHPPSRTAPLDPSEIAPEWIPSAAPFGETYNPAIVPMDLAGSPYREAIEKILQKRYAPIAKSGMFYPKAPLTRGEALLWLYNAYLANGGENVDPTGLTGTEGENTSEAPIRAVGHHAITTNINSVLEGSDGEHRPYFRLLAEKLKLNGVLDGFSELMMNSDWPVKREEFAAMAWIFSSHVKGYVSKVETPDEADSPPPDELSERLRQKYNGSVQDVTPSYLLGVGHLVFNPQGDMYRSIFLANDGIGQLNLSPQKDVTREEAAAILMRLEPELREHLFTSQKQKPASPETRPSDYSRSYEEKTGAVGSAP